MKNRIKDEGKDAKRLSEIIIFIFCILLSAMISVYFGKDLSWDLANYHYYNPYAYLHHRETLDYWPISFIHLFFFPTADFLSYFLINYFKPLTAVFIMGALQGFNIWFTYLIANLFVKRRLFALLLTLIGIYSSHIFTKLGGFENDHVMNIFVLMFLYLQLKYLDTDSNRSYIKMSRIGGILLGIAMSVKLTASIYVCGAIAANFLLPIKFSDRLKYFLIFTICMISAYLALSGYWMLLLWHKYHNPLFPFFNGIFHSPNFPAINFHYDLFIPKTFLQIIFYPIYFSFYGSPGDQEFLDVRFAITFLLFILFGLRRVYLLSLRGAHKTTWQSTSRTMDCHVAKNAPRNDNTLLIMQYWLFAFIIFSYLSWEYYFAIVRYIGVIALLSPLLIYLLTTHLVAKKVYQFYLLFFLFAYMIITMTSTIIIRAPWYGSDYFNIQLPTAIKQTDASLVLIAYPAFALSNQPKPQSYLIPFFPKNWRFVGIPFNDISLGAITLNEVKHIKEIIDKHQHAIYLLATEETMPYFYRIAHDFGLVKKGPCNTITSDRQKISNTNTYICPMQKEKMSAHKTFAYD